MKKTSVLIGGPHDGGLIGVPACPPPLCVVVKENTAREWDWPPIEAKYYLHQSDGRYHNYPPDETPVIA